MESAARVHEGDAVTPVARQHTGEGGASPALIKTALALVTSEVPPNVALARLVAISESPQAIEAVLSAVERSLPPVGGSADRVRLMLGLWHDTPAAWATIRAVLQHARHDRKEMRSTEWGAIFDRVAMVSPAAGVALYSLGRTDLLEHATTSIVQRLQDWGLIGSDRHVLDFGCGSGRLLQALAPLVRSILGIDVSAGMLVLASQNCATLPNVHVVRTDGASLAAIADGAFDLVTAVDVFPYLVSCGEAAAEHQLGELHRVLRPRGTALMINYAYGLDDAAEAAEVELLAKRFQLQPLRIARDDFALWDGRTFLLQRED